MHEMSLCESILNVLEETARSQHFARVTEVRLEVGALAGVEIEALRFGFDAVMRGSLADGVRLEIIEVPGEAWCMQCARTVPISQRFDACPECGGHQLQVTGGEELRIKDLRVE